MFAFLVSIQILILTNQEKIKRFNISIFSCLVIGLSKFMLVQPVLDALNIVLWFSNGQGKKI